jgi:hypothetical protein
MNRRMCVAAIARVSSGRGFALPHRARSSPGWFLPGLHNHRNELATLAAAQNGQPTQRQQGQ